MKKLQIAVIGSAGPEEYDFAKPNSKMYQVAYQIGKILAGNNTIVVSGGKGGVMEAVSRGSKESGGITIAEIAGDGRLESNPYIDVEIVTQDIGFRGPSQLIGMCDAVISIGGGAGTLQELAVAYRMQKPIVLLKGYGGWTDRISEMDFLDERQTIKCYTANSPLSAVKKALSLIQLEVV